MPVKNRLLMGKVSSFVTRPTQSDFRLFDLKDEIFATIHHTRCYTHPVFICQTKPGLFPSQ